MTQKLKLTIRQGETFQRVVRWERPPFIYKSIEAIEQAAPTRLLVPEHGLATGWRAAVVSANGMEEINALHTPPWDNEYHQVTVLDPDVIEINDINAADYSAYTDGGYLQFFTPADIDGYTAEIDIKDRVGGEVLLTLSTANGCIVLNNDEHTIALTIPADDLTSDKITWLSGVWDLEMTSPNGQVTTLYSGAVTVAQEVTTE